MIKEETIMRALKEIKKGFAQYEYFFTQLDSSAWLETLAQHGFFQNPPSPIRDGDRISLAIWPESRYLVRMSARPEAQEVIVRIALAIPKTENSRVHDDLMEIALALQPAYSAKMVSQASEWVQSPFKLLLAEKIARLIGHLANGDEGSAALVLARTSLQLGPDPRASESADKMSIVRYEPRAHFDSFWYQRIVEKAVPELTRAVGLEGVGLFLDLLNDAIEYSIGQVEKENGDEDYIYIRHPAIEQGKSRDDIPDGLLCAARDAACQLIASDSTQLSAVMDLLKKKRWVSFRRLGLHLCRLFPEQGRTVSEEVFQTPEITDQPSLRHEAVLLLKHSFSDFKPATQQKILEWMNRGPNEDSIRQWLEFVGQPITSETVKTISDRRRRDLLAILEGQLPEPYRQTLEELVALMGPAGRIEEPNKAKFGAFAPQSPKSPSELAEMNLDGVISFLETWQPSGGMLEPTAEGMGRELTSLVAQRPVEFAEAASRFKGLDPTYVRSFFLGLTVATKQRLVVDWTPVLDLAGWVTSQPREIPGRTGDLVIKDPDWGWTRDAIIDLLNAGFGEDAVRFPIDTRSSIWQVLRPLADDPFPTVENEKDENFDPALLSINSTRGRALTAVVQYGIWIQQNKEPQPENWQSHSFSDMPEVRGVLEQHLHVGTEPTLSIRSVYGRCLQWLARLDWQWLQANLTAIFPLDNEHSQYFRAAWDSFLSAWLPSTALLPVLLPYYRAAISSIGNVSGMRTPAHPDDLLAEHLMTFYWYGAISADSGDRLLKEFYDNAPDQLRAQAMWFVGTSISGWDEKTPEEPFLRLQALFENRLQSAKQASSLENFCNELMGYGWWFTSGKFPEKWAVEMLLAVLRLTNRVANDMKVVQKLAELRSKYPEECVICLTLMVHGDVDRWLLVGVEQQAEDIIAYALADPKARDSAIGLVEELIARGHYHFRRLLSLKN
ncbi:MAG TPA: hypothetical protein VG759_17275 [Candidatus Angelobacter sp.]|jgi:hypothetical protein|nr:hypothetical protein [Candidatus Angelobacter sp.]